MKIQIADPLEDAQCVVDGIRPEKDPGHIDKREGDDPVQSGMQLFKKAPFPPCEDREKAVERTPKDEGVAGAVPEAADEKDNHHVAVSPPGSFPASTQRDVDIFCEKTGQGDVPALPKFQNR